MLLVKTETASQDAEANSVRDVYRPGPPGPAVGGTEGDSVPEDARGTGAPVGPQAGGAGQAVRGKEDAEEGRRWCSETSPASGIDHRWRHQD